MQAAKPGLSLAEIKHSKTEKVAGYGLADVEPKIPSTPETVQKIGSVSKQITAAATTLTCRRLPSAWRTCISSRHRLNTD